MNIVIVYFVIFRAFIRFRIKAELECGDDS